MGDTNYIGIVVKILESPKQKVLKNDILITRFRAQIPQFRTRRIVRLTFLGNLSRDVTTYYKINDYLLIEGYISIRNQKNANLKFAKSKKIHITVQKVYPFFLNSDRSIKKTSDY
jgi:hypothetical protein